MENLINFDGLENIAENLINKLAQGIGWIANRETPSKIAVETYIEEIKNSNYDAITKAALISSAKKTIKEYCNQNSIINIAMESMDKNAKPEEVDNDWLAQFMDKVRLVSDEQFQIIWGKILAEECNHANSIPKALLHILEQMDAKDAIAFTAICTVSICMEEDEKTYSPVIIEKYREEFYSEIGITYDVIIDLQALGLIERDFDSNKVYAIDFDNPAVTIRYFEESFELPEEMREIPVGNVIFTKAGQALCRAIDVNKNEEFWEKYCLPFLQKSVKNYLKNKKVNCENSTEN